MTIGMRGMAVDTFVAMLTSLAGCLDKGMAHTKSQDLDLASARLAPDMYTLAQQVQLACHYAIDAVARLTGPHRRRCRTPSRPFPARGRANITSVGFPPPPPRLNVDRFSPATTLPRVKLTSVGFRPRQRKHRSPARCPRTAAARRNSLPPSHPLAACRPGEPCPGRELPKRRGPHGVLALARATSPST